MRSGEPDPVDEYFDIVDPDGNPTGRIKRRSDVHQDGDWHCAFHCWVVLEDQNREPSILFQRRSMNKDTYPGKLDVAVGGHYRAGEGFREVVQEIEEELGIAPQADTLINIGRRWSQAVTKRWVDREIEDVYVHCLKEPVSTLQPSREEITAVDVISFSALGKLFGEDSGSVRSRRFAVRPDNTLRDEGAAEVALEDFIPVADGYWVAGARAAVAVLKGRAGVRLDLPSRSG